MALVSVITPCYNAAPFIGQTLQSVQKQTYTQWEYSIVDDGSTDNTSDIVRSFMMHDNRISYIQQANKGVASARNAGFLTINPQSTYVLFLDHDDILCPDALAILVEHLERHAEDGAAFGANAVINADGAILYDKSINPIRYAAHHNKVYRQHGLLTLFYHHIVTVTPMTSPGQCLIRRNVFAETEGFDAIANPCDDWDLWLQIALRHPIGFVDQTTLHWRNHTGNVSKKYAYMRAKRKYVYERFLAMTSGEQHKATQTAYRFGMFDFDADLCWEWCKQACAAHEYTNACQYLARTINYRLQSFGFRMSKLFA